MQTIDPKFDPIGAEVFGPFLDVREPTQVALLDLSECTPYFIFEPNQEKYEVIFENGHKVHLVIDNRFCGLTPFNRAKEPVRMELVYPQKGVFQILTCVSTV